MGVGDGPTDVEVCAEGLASSLGTESVLREGKDATAVVFLALHEARGLEETFSACWRTVS